jgi:hypothetical protein
LRKLPPDVSLGFLRATWRRRIDRAALDRRTFEFCVLAELRDRLRAGDMWVEGSRRYRAVERRLLHRCSRDATQGRCRAVADTAMGWLAERKALLARRLAEVGRRLQPIRWRTCSSRTVVCASHPCGRSRPTKRKACSPRSRAPAVDPDHRPARRRGSLDRPADCFTHLTTGRVHDDPRDPHRRSR